MLIKIQDFPDQNLEFKQDPRNVGNLEFEKDVRQYLYSKISFQIIHIFWKLFKSISSPGTLHYNYIQTSQTDFVIAPQEHLNHPDSLWKQARFNELSCKNQARFKIESLPIEIQSRSRQDLFSLISSRSRISSNSCSSLTS